MRQSFASNPGSPSHHSSGSASKAKSHVSRTSAPAWQTAACSPASPRARADLRLDATWNAWQGQVEWLQVARQTRVAAFEQPTPGYGMLNLGVSYSGQTNGTPWQVYLKGHNLTDRLAYAHTSFIKNAAPLMGRNMTVGVRVAF